MDNALRGLTILLIIGRTKSNKRTALLGERIKEMAIGRSKITAEDRKKAKEQGLVLFEVFIDLRFADKDLIAKTKLKGLKSISFAGVRTAEEASKIVSSVWKTED